MKSETEKTKLEGEGVGEAGGWCGKNGHISSWVICKYNVNLPSVHDALLSWEILRFIG